MSFFRRFFPRRDAELSAATERHLAVLFAPEHREQARRLLVAECGRNLPFHDKASPLELERVRFAALKESGGDLSKLKDAVALANLDWRDLLMSADFAEDPDAHLSWEPDPPAA